MSDEDEDEDEEGDEFDDDGEFGDGMEGGDFGDDGNGGGETSGEAGGDEGGASDKGTKPFVAAIAEMVAQSSDSVEALITEVKCYKLAQNRSFDECLAGVAAALLAMSEPDEGATDKMAKVNSSSNDYLYLYFIRSPVTCNVLYAS